VRWKEGKAGGSGAAAERRARRGSSGRQRAGAGRGRLQRVAKCSARQRGGNEPIQNRPRRWRRVALKAGVRQKGRQQVRYLRSTRACSAGVCSKGQYPSPTPNKEMCSMQSACGTGVAAATMVCGSA